MNYLLKIVEGPMKGAEVALVGGMCVTVGRDDSCDIVIADQTLAATAFKLDVSETGVTLLGPNDEVRPLKPFEIESFGSTSFAIGPAEGKWEALVARSAAPSEVKSEGPSSAEAAEGEEGEEPGEEPGEGETSQKRRGIGCLVWLILLIIVVALVWYFWPKIVEKVPQAETARQVVVEKGSVYGKAGCAKTRGWFNSLCAKFSKKDESPAAPRMTLEDIAALHNLRLTYTSSPSLPSEALAKEGPRLTGNFKLRTERMAVRALALAADPMVKLDLTDDESLLSSANALLYVLSDGAIQATVATNRVIKIAGKVSTEKEFQRVLQALRDDVPGIEQMDVSSFTVGATKAVQSVVSAETITSDTKGETVAPVATSKETKKVAAKKPLQPNLPIAGILTVPYPCIVLMNGQRLLEGAQIGAFTVKTIAAEKLVLQAGDREFEWKP